MTPLSTRDEPAPAAHALAPYLGLSLWRHFFLMVLLCSAISLALWLIDRNQLKWKALYAFCIGFSCWLVIDGQRLLVVWLLERLRVQRGLPPGGDDQRLGWWAMVPIVVIGVLLGPTLGMGVADVVSGGRSAPIWNLTSLSARVTLVITLVATAVAVFGFTARDRMARLSTQAAQAQKAAAENQLRLLQSQLEPHMLFNTLANLRVLIGVDPTRAQAMLDQLIAFLRATLAASRSAQHPLADEFARVADYLALMAIRMGPRLRIDIQLPDALRTVPVPPLLLQPLVENAIKHGLEPHAAGGRILIAARQEGDELVLLVQDDGAGLPERMPTPSAGQHFGVQQVHERLAALHGGRARFELRAALPQGTLAELRLPMSTPLTKA